MGCFCCFDCCKLSKDFNAQFRRREKAGCFCCKRSSLEDRKERKREDRGILCLCCGELSSSNDDSPRTRRCCFSCKQSVKKDIEFREGKENKCFTCFKSSKEKRKERKGTSCGVGCLCCGESSSKDGSTKSKRCFPCKKSSKKEGNDKKCFSCFRSPKEELKERKRRGCGNSYLCCRASSVSDDSSNKRGCCCFPWKKSSKEHIESVGEVGKGCFSSFRSSNEEGKEKKSCCKVGCFCCGELSPKDEPSKTKGCCCFPCKKSSKEPTESVGEIDKGCFSCFRSSKEEGKEKKSCCKIGYFCCGELSSKDEPSKTKGCCCLSHMKSLKEDPKSRMTDKICLCCFRSPKVDSSKKEKVKSYCNNRLSKEDPPKKEGRTSWCSFPCCVGTSKENLSKKGGGICLCFQCCRGKSSKEPVHVEHGNQKKKSKEDSAKKRGRKVMCCCVLCSTKSLVEKKPTSKTKCTLSCFWCIQSDSYQNSSLKKRKRGLSCLHIKEQSRNGHHLANPMHITSFISDNGGKNRSRAKEILPFADGNSAVQVFTYKEIVAATKNFNEDFLLGSGGFGRVYKGELLGKNEVVAVKQLKGNENHVSNEFLVDVVTLSLLHHPNLIKLLGYCAERDQMILVYEYMPFGSLQDHLFDIAPNTKPLDWFTRMKIATGAAKGLEHLHDVANPPMIYRDMKASNILLDENYNPKLSDFGLEKPTRVMGTYGCCAPEYAFTRKLSKTTDVYSFGVLLLELITGRKAIDTTRKKTEQYLAHWAAPLFKDKRKFPKMADPLLNGNFPIKDLYQALAIANMCVQYEASSRPLMSDVVTAIEYLVKPETDCSDPSEEPQIPHQLHPSDHEKPNFQSISCNSQLRTSTVSFDGETFQSLSSDIESCDTLREDEQEED